MYYWFVNGTTEISYQKYKIIWTFYFIAVKKISTRPPQFRMACLTILWCIWHSTRFLYYFYYVSFLYCVFASFVISSDRKPGVGFPGAPGVPDPGAGVGPGDCTCQKPGAGGFLLWKPRGFRGVYLIDFCPKNGKLQPRFLHFQWKI